MKNFETLPLYDKLLNKIYAYFHTIWKEKWKEGIDQEWLSNFSNTDEAKLDKEKINMLYLLSKFMYFGNEELRQLLLSVYRDLFKYPIIASIRKTNGDTTDTTFINNKFLDELNSTRFLGVGNPSESGVHMLYYFRQEAALSKELFIDTKDIFKVEKRIETKPDGAKSETRIIQLCNNTIKRYIFIDDFCGSGTQAKLYLKNKVNRIKKHDPDINIQYLMLFATEHGINELMKLGIFDSIKAVFIIDETFKAFSSASRYYNFVPDKCLEKQFSNDTALKYGQALVPAHPIGYKDCQLLIGFSHNTPDNSLPIFWCENNGWKAIFKRYNKTY